jgi:lipopolysaccharide export system permease protein
LKIFSRYLLKAHLGPLVFGFALIIFILVIDVILQLMDQVLSKGLSPGEAGRLFFYNLAWIIALAVPMAVLIAVLMAFGRLAADNEIMAAKACGIGFLHILRPVLGAAAVLTLLMIWFNDQVLPDSNYEARSILSNLKRRKAALVLKEKEGIFIHKLGNYSLLIRQVDEQANRLHGITLYDGSRPGPPATLHASAGEINIFDDGRYIRLTLYDGEFHHIEADDPERFARGSFGRQLIHIEDKDRAFTHYRSAYRSDREMPISAMYQKVQKKSEEQRQTRQYMDSTVQAFIASLNAAPATAADTTAADTTTTAQALHLRQELERKHRFIDVRSKQINEFWVEIHKKFSIPFACIVFVLVGAPLGALIRQRGTAVSVGVSLIFFLAYWVFLIGGEQLADRGYLPPALAMWAPNLVFGLLGAYLIHAVALDHPLLGRRRKIRTP